MCCSSRVRVPGLGLTTCKHSNRIPTIQASLYQAKRNRCIARAQAMGLWDSPTRRQRSTFWTNILAIGKGVDSPKGIY